MKLREIINENIFDTNAIKTDYTQLTARINYADLNKKIQEYISSKAHIEECFNENTDITIIMHYADFEDKEFNVKDKSRDCRIEYDIYDEDTGEQECYSEWLTLTDQELNKIEEYLIKVNMLLIQKLINNK